MSTSTVAETRSETQVRDIAYVAVFTALIVALAIAPAVNVVGPVPITLQTLGITLAAAILGPRRGTLAVLAYITLIAVGLPVAAGGAGGLGVLTGATAGYIWGWPFMALIIGALSRRVLLARRSAGAASAGRVLALTAIGVIGLVPVYALGVGWLHLGAAGLPWGKAFTVGVVPFLLGDLIKALVAALVTSAVARALPDLAGLRSR